MGGSARGRLSADRLLLPAAEAVLPRRRVAELDPAGPAPAQPVPAGRKRMRPGFRGPLGDLVVADFRAARSAPADITARPAGGGISDEHSVQMFHHLMGPKQPPTALVFVGAAETLMHIESVRGLAEFFAEQLTFRRDVPHSCVLVFRQSALEDVDAFLGDLRAVPALAAHAERQLDRSRRPGLIGYPDEPELTRLVHHLRISAGLQVSDWPELAAVVRSCPPSPMTSAAGNGCSRCSPPVALR